MNKGVALLLAGILVFVAMTAVAFIVDGASWGAVLGFCVAIVGLAWLFWADFQREQRELIETAKDLESRLEELATYAGKASFELKVAGSMQRWPGASAVVLGICIVLLQIADSGSNLLTFAGWLLLGSALIVFGLLSLSAALSARGKPLITLSEDGLETAWSGVIPWDLVYGIYLQDIRIGSTRNWRLDLHVPNLQELTGRFRLPFRWFYQFRPLSWGPHLCIMLTKTSDHPQAIYRTARWLWTKRTGRSYEWNPNMSAEIKLAMQRDDHSE